MLLTSHYSNILKALSSEVRFDLLVWTANPDRYFEHGELVVSEEAGFSGGVSMVSLQSKAGISQSTLSYHMDVLTKANLVESRLIAKHLYYRANKPVIADFLSFFDHELL